MATADTIFLVRHAIPLPGNAVAFKAERFWKGEPRNFVVVRTYDFPYAWLMLVFSYENIVIAHPDAKGLFTQLCSGPLPTDIYQAELAQLNTYPSTTPDPIWPKVLGFGILLLLVARQLTRVDRMEESEALHA
jgi:hypothetical protein